MKKMICWLTVILLLVMQCYAFAKEDRLTLLTKTDQLYRDYIQTNDEEQIKTAISIFDDLLTIYPDDWEICWKAARCYNEYAPVSEDPISAFETGADLAQRSIGLKDNADAHFWLAALYGQIGQARGILKSLFMVKPICEEFEKCIALNPNYDYAYHALSIIYTKVPGRPISIGDYKKALEYELKAVQLVPNHFHYQWALYKIYRKLGRQDEAESVLKTILNLPLDYDFDNIYREELTAEEIKKLAAEAID